jgi:hypothetical protein
VRKEEQGNESESVDIGQVWYVRLMRLHAEYLGVACILWRKEESARGYAWT